MSAPYTNETLDRIRDYASKGWPPGAAAIMLGWDLLRLERISNHHGICFPVYKPKTQKPSGKLDAVLDETERGFFASSSGKSVKLSPSEARIFQVLLNSPTYGWTNDGISERCKVHRSSVSMMMTKLRKRLRKIGLELTNKKPYYLDRA